MMGKTIMGCAAVSADGYIAYHDGQIGSLFDWMSGGDVEWRLSESDEHPVHTTQASKDFMKSVYPNVGAVIMGRNLFDQTNGWNGKPAAGEHVFVVTHKLPTDWEHAGTAPFTFVTDGVESAIRQAQEFCGDRIVDVAAGQIGGQALRLGLIDQTVMNVVPVVFGGGRPFFGAMEPGGDVVLGNPSRVAQGNRVTHLLYDVEY
jgi:dihydrofolate reductase